MAGEVRVKHRLSPIVIVRLRRRARHLPARQRGAGFSLRAMAQKQAGDAAFSRRQGQPPAGHQVQAFGHALDFQQQRAHMRTGQNVIRRRQGVRGIARSYQDQRPRIATQFEQAVGRYRAIFHRLIIGPDPEQRFSLCRQQGQQRGKAAGAPSPGEDFVQRTGTQAATQHGVCLWMTGWHRTPFGR